MIKEQILITNTEFEKGLEIFRSQEGVECFPGSDNIDEFAQEIVAREIKYAVVGVQPITGKLYDAIPENGVIARFGVGYDNVDTKLATSKGIFCTNTPGVLDDSVAEHTVALLLEICRKVGKMDNSMKEGEWQPVRGRELKGKTICIVGCGNIGCKTARILKYGLGMKIHAVAYDKQEQQKLSEKGLFSYVTTHFEEGVNGVDFVSLHIPSTKENFHFMNKWRLSKIPAKGWLLNTSRGQVINEGDLYNALSSKSIAGAALDVFEEEPYVPQNPDNDLRSLQNIILTPHVASNTVESCNRMALCVIKNIRLAIKTDYHSMDLVNQEILSMKKQYG